MWRFERNPIGDPVEIDRFLEVVNAHADFFAGDAPVYVARAPGRLDLMGGIADYSGSLVLQFPLAVGTYVAAQPASEPIFTALSTAAADLGYEPLVSLPMETLTGGGVGEYGGIEVWKYGGMEEGKQLETRNPKPADWVAYVAGVLVVLQRECGFRLDRGLRLLIHSNVPPGKGVASSATLEVAAMQAICGVYNLPLDGREIALLCQRVENRIVGAPCGVMDQMTAACGQENHLLALLCQPAELQPFVPLPPEIEIWGIDSGIRHAVSGADYGSVRAGAFMGYRIIAEQAGLRVTAMSDGKVTIEDPRWHGYLANISPSEWETHYCHHVPITLDGASFLARYGGSTDAVTRIDPMRTYPVRQPTAHPIYEHHRVSLFRVLLRTQPLSEEVLHLLGELMYQSHASYSACGLGSDGTDRLVELVREAGPDAGLYGAKITGGGSGGTVALLGRRGASAEVKRIAEQYERETGRSILILSGSSPGSLEFGVHRMIKV